MLAGQTDSSNTQNSSAPELLSITEAAKLTPYSAEYLSLLVRRGKLRAVKDGRNWVTSAAWLKEYLEKPKKHGRTGVMPRAISVTPPVVETPAVVVIPRAEEIVSVANATAAPDQEPVQAEASHVSVEPASVFTPLIVARAPAPVITRSADRSQWVVGYTHDQFVRTKNWWQRLWRPIAFATSTAVLVGVMVGVGAFGLVAPRLLLSLFDQPQSTTSVVVAGVSTIAWWEQSIDVAGQALMHFIVRLP